MVKEFIYGPFKSRRLGLSLGVDILPKVKTCTFNCVYCEIGSTSIKENQLVPPSCRVDIKPRLKFQKELKSILKYIPHLDSITFGYNGEPTLNQNLSDFLQIAKKVRENFEWEGEKPKLTLFTNSSTLINKEIRERIKEFELILAKLDAGTKEDFKRTNRPHPETPSIQKIIDSLINLKKELPNGHKLAIQTLIYLSYDDFQSNNNQNNITYLARAIKRIKPDKVQIYSTARTPAEYYVHAIDDSRKREIRKRMKQKIRDKSIKIQYF
ncbi:MAG: hypothetical protein R6U96_18060 [Promethearchaeia archaeon]